MIYYLACCCTPLSNTLSTSSNFCLPACLISAHYAALLDTVNPTATVRRSLKATPAEEPYEATMGCTAWDIALLNEENLCFGFQIRKPTCTTR